jgi:hypothetical protein
MPDPSVLQVRQIAPRSYEIETTTPFVQSECTGGHLCGAQFQQGCYASPDFSTCSYSPSEGVSMCTVCICYGSESGGGCDKGSGSATTTPQPDLFSAATSTVRFSFKSVIVLLLCFCVWFDVLGLFCCFWYGFFFLSFALVRFKYLMFSDFHNRLVSFIPFSRPFVHLFWRRFCTVSSNFEGWIGCRMVRVCRDF